ncbi:TolC family protein [Caldinitratiruptor microaerophilus]|uniref:TolC family protein n=1 Tax=Caldinitratiruptor microaerophilus TaxID=671077 RepID=A0AA35G6S9_9FIRM|nr:TolC family protein [Caldinitratiruptor microaerophilus]BDG59015.1 hypothetical protein caldi_01050 [Caldinitratiruptor microaerophilus]
MTLLAVGLAFVAGGTGRAAGAGGEVSLSLGQATEKALASSQQVRLAELAVERDRLGVREARNLASTMRDLQDMPLPAESGPSGPGKIDVDLAVEVGPGQAQDALYVSERNVEAVKRQVQADAEQAYFSALLAQEAVKVRQESLRLAEEQLRLARVGLEAGVRARAEVLAAEVQVAQARAALQTEEKNRELAFAALRQKLGLPAETRITLTDPLAPGELPATTLDEALRHATENSLSLYQLSRGVEHQKKVVEIVARYLPGTFRHRKELYTQKQLEIRLEDARNQLELAVRGAYLDMVNAHAQIAQYDKAIEQAEENLRLQRLRYEAGLGTGVEVDGAASQLTAVRLQRLKAVYDFRVSRSKFDLLVQGPPVSTQVPAGQAAPGAPAGFGA